MKSRVFGYILLVVAVVMIAVVLYRNSRSADNPLLFSPVQMMSVLWNSYKKDNLEANTFRTMDKDRNDITTSEGESYTMLRAVWMGDKETFDASWKWTKDNLQHKDDHLFSWLFGKKSNGSYGILSPQGGDTAASDADSDIAFSLLLAYSRWQDKQYLLDSHDILNDVWNKEVITIQGTTYLLANDIDKATSTPLALINPSYFHPASYRIFSLADPGHPWGKLIDGSYSLLEKSTSSPLNTGKSVGLPPDWIAIDKETGSLQAVPANSNLTTNFGYDALRIPWEIALDWQWSNDARAKNYLSKLSFLSSEWAKDHKLYAVYTHAGDGIGKYETPAMYGGTIGYFIVTHPNEARSVYKDKLAFLFNPDTNSFKETLSYYDDNWAWFGIGLYNNLLPNLTSGLPLKAYKLP
jgi:endo-1,4-beta-D-glucanase Y